MAINTNSKAYQSLLAKWYTASQIEQMSGAVASWQSAKDVIANTKIWGTTTSTPKSSNQQTITYNWQVSDRGNTSWTANMNSMSQNKAIDNSRNFQVGTWDVAEMPQQPKIQSTTTKDNRLAKAWQGLDYETQQKKLSSIAWLKDALAKKGITSKSAPTTTQTTTTPKRTTQAQTPKQEQWDYQDNSQARMDQIANNLNGYRQTMPQLFDDMSAFYNFFIKDKGRSQDQIDFLWDYYNRVQKYGKYDNMSPDELWKWIANWNIPEDYLNTLKATDPAKYQEVMASKKDTEDTIKNEGYLNDAAVMAWIEWWESEPSSIKYAKRNEIWMDEDSNWIDDRREHYATEEEKWYQKQIADLNAANLDIDNTVKHDYEDLVEKYPWATKATLMAMANDRNAKLLREKENNLVELTRLQGYVSYMQSERQEMNAAGADSIRQLQDNLWMYYDYSPQWMAELAQAKYAATNITLDQADSWNETQKQMALESVLDGYYKKYWDIIQRSEKQVINDVIAYAKKNWVWLAQALQENFVKPLQQKPQFAAMESAYSEPNLQVMWYNSDWKAVYGYWDSATKTFKPVSVWAGWIWWVWTSWETDAEPLNDFIDTLLWDGLTIASNWWSWGSKIRSWGCWTVVNDYLWSIWDNIKLSEANDIKSYATSKTPAVWWIAYFDWTQSRATPETKKHGHVWIVTKDNWDTITVLESNTWTWLRYKDYKKSAVTWYYVPEWIKSTSNTASYDNVFTKAGNAAFVGLWAMNRAAAEANLKSSLEDGDYSGAFEYITLNAKNSADSDTKSKISAAETAAIDLIAIRDALDAYLAAWWDTGLLKWSLEKVANKLGKTTDPQLASIAVKISEAIQAYRKHITWAAFSKEEAKEYADLFPTISADEEYNAAKLDWTLNSMVTRLNQLYWWLLWPRTYINMLDAHEKATWRKYSVFEEQSDLYNYLKDNWYLNTDWSVKEAQDFATYMQSQNQRKGKRF